MEADGTQVDEDDVLVQLKNETFILLQQNEIWKKETVENDLASTITVTSGTSSLDDSLSSSYNIENDEIMWSSFEIPFEKIPKSILDSCVKGENKKYVRNQMVHIIIDELRNIKEIVPYKVLRSVAKALSRKYPKTFLDVDDGKVIGEGYLALFFKLSERASYLRRPHKRQNNEPSVPQNLIRKKVNVMAGCVDWAPSGSLDNDVITNLNEVTEDNIPTNFEEMLERIYPQHRHFLNNVVHPPTVDQIRKEHPILFNKEAIFWHFKKLTGKDIKDLSTGFTAKSSKLLNFGLSQKILNKERIDSLPSEASALLCITNYFKEDISFIWQLISVSSRSIPCNLRVMKMITGK